eukprot:CAMPEP_0201169654 /NCGR_PEP_ID=MMETSP0851-20130426/80970_1 /ASSEMBLY_ACC=CAM_ASM_000631 /TAXON_ID=183588 /ORGANISM="Pseudo-nitzschia fraudulenta, Strain WWA7" /LENGTH=533 /DNA_ID=CAMNT_0047451473 /DNA_START=52 /DNA_END=1653 /DNA_ORIENTATION=+
MNNEDSAFVLYVDHKGHPAPLSLSYHATASRRLTSSVDRHPPSSVTEVDSAYCPQCLSFHDANTAGILGFCQKPTCRLCPVCRSVVSIAVDGSLCFYKCGLCDWSSKACQLQTNLATPPGEEGQVSLEAVEKASKVLLSQLKAMKADYNKIPEDHFSNMSKTMIGRAKDHVKGQRSFTRRVFSTGLSTKRIQDGDLSSWSIAALEDSQRTRRKAMKSSINQPIGGNDLKQISLDGEDEPLYHQSFGGLSVETILSQETGAYMGGSTERLLLPLPIPLRPRKSRRCRAELADSRPGILVKPKLNPLEGDSSLRTGHGQWWKKDSSAIEVLPRVRVSIDASDGTRHAFLIKVSNPTLGIVRLRMAPSDYSGECVWDSETKTSALMENLIVDPLKKFSVDAHLDTNVAKAIKATSLCELEPAEDSFLELGNKTSNNVPEAVSRWEAGDALFDSKVSKETPATLRELGQKKSVAWFELIVWESVVDRGVHSAVPITMQLQVGDGSWESSLVQSQDDGSPENKDFVSFDLVLIWEKLL